MLHPTDGEHAPRQALEPQQGQAGHSALGRIARDRARRDRLGDPRRARAGRAYDLAAAVAPLDADRARPRRSRSHLLGDRLGGARDAALARPPVRLKRLLPASALPGLLGFAARLRADRLVRLGDRRSARALQPAVPVGLVAVLRRRLSARARARDRARRRRCRRRGLRLRALQDHRGRAPARHLRRRHRAVAVPAAARIPPPLKRIADRGLAGGRLADLAWLHAGPAVGVPDGGAHPDSRLFGDGAPTGALWCVLCALSAPWSPSPAWGLPCAGS